MVTTLHYGMVELRYIIMEVGEQCATLAGVTKKLMWCVDNWDLVELILQLSVS